MTSSAIVNPIPKKLVPIEVIVGQVCGVTKLRRDTFGAQNFGVLVKDVDTRDKEWHNCYNTSDISYGDFVRVVVYRTYAVFTVITAQEAREF